MKNKLLWLALAGPLVMMASCARVTVDPIEVKPITINVNIRVDRQLDQFFAFEDKMDSGSGAATQPPATRPVVNSDSQSSTGGIQ